MIRDVIVERRVHKVYLYALPILIVCQIAAMETFVRASPWWMNVANRIVRQPAECFNPILESSPLRGLLPVVACGSARVTGYSYLIR